MGLRRNFSKDDPDSKAHKAARKSQHSRRGTSRLEVRRTPAETATNSRYRKTKHNHGSHEQVRSGTTLRDTRFLRACILQKRVNLNTQQ
ncbi:hypothetical protein PAMP_024252 [Pampus punctatissimus]